MRAERLEPVVNKQPAPAQGSAAAHCVETLKALGPGATLEADLTSSEYRQCIFVVNGSGTITLDGLSWDLGPGMLAVAPNRCLCVLKLNRGARAFRIAAQEGFLRAKVMPALFMPQGNYWTTTYRTPNVFPLWTGPRHAVTRKRILRELESAREKLGMDCDGSVISYMYVILTAAWRELLHQKPATPKVERSSSMELAMSFRELVDQRFRDHLRLPDYCGLLGVTPARLARACKSLMACTPSHLIHERLLDEAKRELSYSSRTVSEIAYALGFEEVAYFCRFFKQHTHHSPIEYRKVSRM
jgi:AraC-like DNA-binding protein